MALPSSPPEGSEPEHRTLHRPLSGGERTSSGAPSDPSKGHETLPGFQDIELEQPNCPPRYRLLSLLGQGGMGRVFKARDLQLQRMVALKFIHGEDPLLAERLLLEARVLASLGHPNICQVFDVGDKDGHPYIALQYIEGNTLARQAKDLSLHVKVDFLAQIAEALHAAHRKGLIHRDVKPENIMVETLEDGSLHPILMDFGLALAQGDPGASVPGIVMGTPNFMAPEQARGEEALVDRRSDVYALGATLYAVVLGHSPFHSLAPGESLRRLQEEVPEPMRKEAPHLPLDLDTIALKCLAKDPGSRYDSALALAEDLRRFLRGEPILARPVGRLETLSKWMRRNQAMARLLAGAGDVVLLLGGWGLATHLRSQRLSEYATGFGAEAEKMALGLRMAYLLPRHDLESDRTRVLARMEVIRARSQQAGGLARGPGAFALGQGYLALQDYSEAKRELEKAWSLGFRSGDVALALGRTLGQLYRRGTEELGQMTDPDEREARKQELVRTLRDPSLVLLRQVSQEKPEQRAYLEGLLAFYEERYPDALARTREAFDQDPGLYEAKQLEGQVLVAMGREEMETDPRQSMDHLMAAATPLERALGMAHSDPDLLFAEGTRRLQILVHRTHHDSDLGEAYVEAQAALDQVLEADPRMGTVYGAKATGARALAFFLNTHGKDPFAALDQAIAWCDKAAGLMPGKALLFAYTGDIHRFKAQAMMQRGMDPRPEIQRSITSLEEAVRLEPGLGEAQARLATIFLLQADLVGAGGGDPRPILEQGLLRAEEALRLQPKMANAANVAGGLCSSLAELEGAHGQDPSPFYLRAIAFNQQAVANGPSYGLYLNDLADGYLRLASHLRRVGRSSNDALREGLEAAEKSTRVSPDYLSLLTFGELLTLQAQILMDRGEDPFPSLKKGWDALRKSEAINASDYLTFWEQGNLALIRGQAELTRGDSPAASWREAEALIRRASGLNPKAPEPLLSSARLAVVRGAWEASHGTSPSASIRMGEEAILRGFALNPRQPNLLALRGCLRLLRARTDKGMPRQHILESAQADLEQALEQNPFLAHDFDQDLALVKRLRAFGKKVPGRG